MKKAEEWFRVAWSGEERMVARLRVCTTASKHTALSIGPHAITGGLGGLGLRAAVLQFAGRWKGWRMEPLRSSARSLREGSQEAAEQRS